MTRCDFCPAQGEIVFAGASFCGTCAAALFAPVGTDRRFRVEADHFEHRHRNAVCDEEKGGSPT